MYYNSSTEDRCNTKSSSFQLHSHHQSSTEKITTQKCDSPKNNGFSTWIKYQSSTEDRCNTKSSSFVIVAIAFPSSVFNRENYHAEM
ncbi:hypothetical protein T4A_8593 [Trichinella pseudospiralis]|uniref:Uncharacterized protein n=1 Tax=Trichinella pseudospiralis TaxID=6337 RepID=A0A0V1EP97_TRIPS|nr:hypothetical protein T4A_8593 [Trichinella pseudospiralis]